MLHVDVLPCCQCVNAQYLDSERITRLDRAKSSSCNLGIPIRCSRAGRTGPVNTNEVDMGKVMIGLIVVMGLWVGMEFFSEGPSRAFNGAFAGWSGSEKAEVDTRSTAQRAGDSVNRSQAAAEARRARMLGE
jgi:hypothetical protein